MKRSNFNATGRTATAVQKKLPARKETATVTAMKTVWAPCTVRLTTVLGLVLMTQMIAVLQIYVHPLHVTMKVHVKAVNVSV